MADSIIVTTSVPSVSISDTGLAIPDEIDILNGRLSDLDSALGGGMSKSLTTPQGQIAVSETAIVTAKNDELAELANVINPDYSYGRFQDGIARIYFIDRKPALGTTVNATCTGLVGTVIPAGSYAQDTAGYLYYSLAAATIPASGNVAVVFRNQATGAIPCAIGKLNTIYRAVTGWSSINNDTAGILGNDVEGRANFEYRRKQSVAKNARNTLGAIYAAVLAADGVVDAYVTDNKKSTADARGVTGYRLKPNSFYVAVYGGESADIAAAINASAPPAVNMNGDTAYTVQDKDNYVYPYPEYEIQWQTPTPVSVSVNVQLQSNESLPENIADLVKTSVISAFNGEDGGTRARIGSTIFAGRYYAGVQAIDTESVNILGITLARDRLTFTTSISFGIDEIPTIDAANIVVALVTT